MTIEEYTEQLEREVQDKSIALKVIKHLQADNEQLKQQLTEAEDGN